MYFSNLTIDGVAERVPEIFNYNESEQKFYAKKTKTDEGLDDAPFPVEPVLWPVGMANCDIRSFRGAGATAILYGGGDGLVVQLNTGTNYDSFVERRYLSSAVAVAPLSGTVLSDLRSRSLWSNAADSVAAPRIGGSGAASTDAALSRFVKEGKHIEGVAARLIALAIEHTLVPFTNRTRARNAAACYWCTGKYRSDGIAYSIQNSQALLQWATPGGVGEEHDPTAVVWVGTAEKVRGMSLLSRIMDAGGPIMIQESHLLKQFDAGRLLLVGTGALARDLRPVEASDLYLAIDEALWLLKTYNNLQDSFVVNTIRLIIRNLPMVDMTHYLEKGGLYWRAKDGTFGDPDLGGGIDALVDDAINTAFPMEVRTTCGLDNVARSRGVLSDLFRRDVLSPPADLGGMAPHTDHPVRWEVLGMVAAMQSVAVGDIAGTSVHYAEFDAAIPPAVPNIPAFARSAMNDVMAVFSGRAGFHLFAYSPPPDAAGNFAPIPGWARVAAAPADLVIPAGVAHDGQWLEWVGGHDAAGIPITVRAGLRAYVIRQWLPTTADNYPPTYVAPPAHLRRFDLGADVRMGVRPNGAWPDLRALAPHMADYVNENVGDGNPLDYLTEDGQRGMAGLSNGQKSLAYMRGVAYVWDAHAGGRTQNDAYARWVTVNHRDRRLTTVPDELMLYVGGCRSRRYVDPNGGLWTLCFQESPSVVNARCGIEVHTNIIKDKQRLASYILKLRCAVEMADQMWCMSNSRVRGCLNPYLWPAAVDDRLNRGRVEGTTDIDNATYLSRQALVLATVFDHPDSAVCRTFNVTACSTMRLREPTLGVAVTLDRLKHMNWLAPQTLWYRCWTNFYGVAAPSFIPDRKGVSWLREARFTTAWQGVDDNFQAGAMMHRSDEIWCAMLTAFQGNDWFPAALDVVNFGKGLRIDVSDTRTTFRDGFTPLAMRLNLPLETRLAVVTVHDTDLDEEMRPVLPCDGAADIDDGDDTPQSIITYDARGKVVSIVLDPARAADWENVDLSDTTLFSDGADFSPVQPTNIVGDYLPVERAAGHFWMAEVPIVGSVAAGMCAGAQRLISYLQPPPPIAAGDDGGGKEVRGGARVDEAAPNIAKIKPPEEHGAGDLPMLELNTSSAETILSSISGASEEVMALLRNALLKGKTDVDRDGSTATTADITTSSDTQDDVAGGGGEHSS